jgi:hypothetical protein
MHQDKTAQEKRTDHQDKGDCKKKGNVNQIGVRSPEKYKWDKSVQNLPRGKSI